MTSSVTIAIEQAIVITMVTVDGIVSQVEIAVGAIAETGDQGLTRIGGRQGRKAGGGVANRGRSRSEILNAGSEIMKRGVMVDDVQNCLMVNDNGGVVQRHLTCRIVDQVRLMTEKTNNLIGVG